MESEIQYDLYFAAYLTEFQKNVLIPDYWVETLNLADNNTIENITSTSHNDDSAIIQNDVFSGQLLFQTTETNDRYYEDFDAAVRAPIIQCLTGWNSTHPFNTNFYDKRFVGVLLKELFGDNYSDKELVISVFCLSKHFLNSVLKMTKFVAWNSIRSSKKNKNVPKTKNKITTIVYR